MRTLAIQIIILQALLCLCSCEKDFVYDKDCQPNGGQIIGWGESTDTTVIEKRDTTSGGFHIELNEWGDTINNSIPI